MDQVFLNKVIAIIEANLENEKFGVEELSQELGMSRSNINRRLRSLQKNSISQLIQEIRLHRAMEMLQQKVATASEVAFRRASALRHILISAFMNITDSRQVNSKKAI